MAATLRALLALLLVCFSSTDAAASISLFPSSSTDHSRPLILPLSRTSRRSSSLDRDTNFRRRLRDSETTPKPAAARMRLYDDLLSNGYYTTRLYIGTPPQKFALIVDTGSTVTYVPCSGCEQCGKHQDPRFQPELSSTYEPVKCNSQCNCDPQGEQCTYERRYAEMSSSSGLLSSDILSFGNESELLPQRAVFGCENKETGDLYKQRADGIMGLGRGYLSIVNQLVQKGVIGDSFSLCYGGMGLAGGAMILGAISPPSDMVFSHSDPHRSPYYNLEMKEIHVAGEPLNLKHSTFNGGHGTVLDSGTTYAYLPSKAYTALKDAIIMNIHSLKQIPGPDSHYQDLCFAGAGRNISNLSQLFPEVDMVFKSGSKLSLSPENYLFRHTKVPGAYCLGIFKNENEDTTLLGGIIVRNTLVNYDREKNKIGFWKTNCSELWEKMQVAAAPAPVGLIPQSHNTSLVPPPSEPPSGLSSSELADKIHIGLITFDMSFTPKDSNTKPNFTELSELIAHELDIDASQVRLLNFTQKENYSIIRWAIYPAKSAEYIAKSEALSIIMRLRDHHVQLPERVGNYELVQWSIVPPKKQAGRRQRIVAVAVPAAVAVLLSLLIAGVWFVWRKKQQSVPYEPVGSSVPEQELQPL